MDEKKTMLAISAKLQPKAANVIARTLITKGSDKMYARYGGGLKHSIPENPWWGRVEIQTEYIGLVVGTNYSSHVSGAAVRSGAATDKKDVDVKTKQSWHTWENRFFETDRATKEKFYLKIQSGEDTMQSAPMVTMRETYFIDGKPHTRKEAEKVLDGYLKPIKAKKPTSTQIAAGVTAGHEIHYYMPRLTDIISIKQGDYTYTR